MQTFRMVRNVVPKLEPIYIVKLGDGGTEVRETALVRAIGHKICLAG